MKKVVNFIIVIGIISLVVGGYFSLGIDDKINNMVDNKYKNITEEELPKELMQKIEFTYGSKYYDVYYGKKQKASKLPNAAKLSLAGSQYRRKNNESYQMTKEEMKEELINIFGSEVEYKDEDFNAGVCFAESMKMEDEKYIFTGGCNGLNKTKTFYTKIIKAIEKKDSIEITEKVAYVLPKEIDMQNNKSSLNIYSEKNGKFLGTVEMNEEFDIDKYLDNLNTYKFKFKKEGNNYYFDSVKEVK